MTTATPRPAPASIRPVFVLRVRPERDCADPIQSLRALLKTMLRKYRLRCLSIEPEQSSSPPAPE